MDGSVRESDGFKPPNLGVFWGGPCLGAVAICHLFSPWFLGSAGLLTAAPAQIRRLGRVWLYASFEWEVGVEVGVGGQRWWWRRWWWRCGREEGLLPSLYRSLPVLVGVDSLGRVVRHPRFLRFFGEFRGWGR